MPNGPKNLLLASLSKSDFDLLGSHLRPFEFRQNQVLCEAGDTVSAVYFPYDAVVSLVVPLASGEMIEAAMVGRDGVSGGAAALDGKISLSRAITQIRGQGVMCDVDALKRVALQSPTLLSLLVRHEQVVYAQAQQTAACNVLHSIEERLARWLLRARDLSQSEALPFTQDFLSEMLGVQRSRLSVVAHTLQQAGILKYARGRIHITNPEGLREIACECYGSVKSHYATLLGLAPNNNNTLG